MISDMSNDNSYKEIALSVFEAMNTSNFSEFEKNAADDLSFDFPGAGRVEGVKRVILFFKILLRKYNKLTFTVSDVIVENKKACVVWTNKGEEKDGKPYKNSGITLFHFTDDKVSLISDYFKDTSFINSK
ncbi:MAG: nuclear transport factor 2 family protein [Bacteroidales bacterium]|nr:nuclear transport factor 2 family protein [Bacteroidales bacterium]